MPSSRRPPRCAPCFGRGQRNDEQPGSLGKRDCSSERARRAFAFAQRERRTAGTREHRTSGAGVAQRLQRPLHRRICRRDQRFEIVGCRRDGRCEVTALHRFEREHARRTGARTNRGRCFQPCGGEPAIRIAGVDVHVGSEDDDPPRRQRAERGDAFAGSLDERTGAGQKERHVRAERACDGEPVLRGDGAEVAVDCRAQDRGRIGRSAAESGADRNVLAQRDGERRSGRTGRRYARARRGYRPRSPVRTKTRSARQVRSRSRLRARSAA